MKKEIMAQLKKALNIVSIKHPDNPKRRCAYVKGNTKQMAMKL